MATIKKLKDNKYWAQCRENRTHTSGGNVNCASHYEKQYGSSSNEIKKGTTFISHESKRKPPSQRTVCTPTFTSASFTIPRYGNNPNLCWWTHKENWDTHTVESSPNLKNKGNTTTCHKMDPKVWNYRTLQWVKQDTEIRNTTWSHLHVKYTKVKLTQRAGKMKRC